MENIWSIDEPSFEDEESCVRQSIKYQTSTLQSQYNSKINWIAPIVEATKEKAYK